MSFGASANMNLEFKTEVGCLPSRTLFKLLLNLFYLR